MRGTGRWLWLGGAAALFSFLAWVGAGLVILQGSNPGRAVVRATVDLATLQEQAAVGDVIDQWRGVPVRANGIPYDRSVGSHASVSGYYYGRQWQCVEFAKRFYFDALGHAMPDVMGDAGEFFDRSVPSGSLNPKRGLIQYANGGTEPPAVDDLMVWNDGSYGHVAIVTRVTESEVGIIQQNVRQGSRAALKLALVDGGCRVFAKTDPAGWLRKAK